MKKATKTTDLNQKSIDSFFIKPQSKRSSENMEPLPKQPKIASNNLSPEQKERIEKNRLRAQNVLQDKALAGIDMGSSWKSALSKEFDKPYFTQVFYTVVLVKYKLQNL